ncbi:MBL fold metallo-hydrolase [Fusobacterium pseudoperiodonticum]|uniref:MBL fold metallo-hydrolase n=1 Tax=Fusobacterium pseudoperiodonticum TaxID=2663009 RepID=UPI000C1BB747|nr:MBL fold metallo-hydrolase [Fusobacterium pseudoperiodonticum]ATV57067.1 hydrolase [Fusobacterium pseudoperiodonticum]ATV68355.1 hydrolase [Fusobacterium pseudoperiodonticum]
MEINIIRGQNQIGGSIIEISSKSTKIILDIGSNLEDKEIVVPEIDGLFKGEAKYDGVLISHYHSDHVGLATRILPDIPIYMGEKSYEIHKVSNEYMEREYLKEPKVFKVEEEFIIGDIKIIPYLCDHSAFDAYMFLLDCEGKKILYTGDFRSNGRKSFEPLLRKLPKVDVLITEGTNLSNNKIGKINLTEKELEKKGIEILEGNDRPVFVLMASTNIDRIVTFYKIANATKRLFLIDTYAGQITATIGGNIPNPRTFSNVKIFLTSSRKHEILENYKKNKISRDKIANSSFLMCVRASMKKYLEKYPEEFSFEGCTMFYSMWEGYKKQENMKEFLEFMKEKGVKIISLHTSGHADEKDFDRLIKKVEPKIIIPVHTENSEWFKRYENCEVICDKNIIKI